MRAVRPYIFDKLQADGIHRGEDFRGMPVYAPDDKKTFFGGYPSVVFAEQSGGARLFIPRESIEHSSVTEPPMEGGEEA